MSVVLLSEDDAAGGDDRAHLAHTGGFAGVVFAREGSTAAAITLWDRRCAIARLDRSPLYHRTGAAGHRAAERKLARGDPGAARPSGVRGGVWHPRSSRTQHPGKDGGAVAVAEPRALGVAVPCCGGGRVAETEARVSRDASGASCGSPTAVNRRGPASSRRRRKCARGAAPAGRDREALRVGFLVVHDGQDFCWALLDWWRHESVLHHRLFVAPLDGSAAASASR